MIYTFLANQVPLAGVIHSLAWIPVSIQIPGRFEPPVLNYVGEGAKKGRFDGNAAANHGFINLLITKIKSKEDGKKKGGGVCSN